MDPHEEFDEAEVEEIKSYIQDGDLSGACVRIKDYLESLETAPLNIAVTGESGTGKSTFINTILELSDEDAADTGVVETTMESKAYSHPKYKNVKYWDLPGIGSLNFRAEEYLEKVHLVDYDFFIIIASERFRENNIQLAQAIQAKKKKFYFVRSKIGRDIDSSKKERRKSFNEDTILEKIRENCFKCFRQGIINNPKVFLIDCFEKGRYDYGVLQETMEKELPDHKKHIFLMSLPNISLSVLEKKKKALRQQIWLKAFLSCAAAALSISGLGPASDDTIIVKTMREYQTVFGLDERSLNKLSELSGKSVSDLKLVIKSPHVIGELNAETMMKTVSGGTMALFMAAKRLNSQIAMFGSLAAGGVVSYVRMYQMLNQFLLDCAEDAQRVIKKSWEDEV